MLFVKYDGVNGQKEILKEAENRKTAFNSAQKYEYIAVVSTDTAYKKKQKRIAQLVEDLKELSDESTKDHGDLSSIQAKILRRQFEKDYLHQFSPDINLR